MKCPPLPLRLHPLRPPRLLRPRLPDSIQIIKMVLCQDVKDREPVQELNMTKVGSTVVGWMQVQSPDDVSLTHRWIHEGETVSDIPLPDQRRIALPQLVAQNHLRIRQLEVATFGCEGDGTVKGKSLSPRRLKRGAASFRKKIPRASEDFLWVLFSYASHRINLPWNGGFLKISLVPALVADTARRLGLVFVCLPAGRQAARFPRMPSVMMRFLRKYQYHIFIATMVIFPIRHLHRIWKLFLWQRPARLHR